MGWGELSLNTDKDDLRWLQRWAGNHTVAMLGDHSRKKERLLGHICADVSEKRLLRESCEICDSSDFYRI